MEPEIWNPSERAIVAYNNLLGGFNVLGDAAQELADGCEREAAASWLPSSGAIGGIFSAATQAKAGCDSVVAAMDTHLARCSDALDELGVYVEPATGTGQPPAELVEKAERLAAACYRIAGVTAPVIQAVKDAQPAEVIAQAAAETAGEVGKLAAGGAVIGGIGLMIALGVFLALR